MAKDTEQKKQKSQEMLASISTDTPFEREVIELIYGFVRSLHKECMAREGGAKV